VVQTDAEDPSVSPSTGQGSPSRWSYGLGTAGTLLQATQVAPPQASPEPAEEPSIPPQTTSEGRRGAAFTSAAPAPGNNSTSEPSIPDEEPRSIPPRAITEHRARVAAAAAAVSSPVASPQSFQRPGPYGREPPGATGTASGHAAHGGGPPSGSSGASATHWMPWPLDASTGAGHEMQGGREWAARRPGRVWGSLPGDPWEDSYGWMDANQAPAPPNFPPPPPDSPPEV